MHFVSTCALLLASVALPMAGAALPTSSLPSPSGSDVTVILDMKGPWSQAAIREMKREASRIIETSGVQLDWKQRGEAANLTFRDLVVMTFKGSCAFDPAPPAYDELGAYAITRTANGEVQPFGEVDCDRVVNSVRSAMFGGDYTHADLLVGRALGRVVAHELVHMLTKSGQHAHEGVQKPALSGRQLISSSLPLSALDVERLREERGIR
ncbi:MAG TPA: hypothetical protein VHB50_02720 [Bryobacteraceae bacterium]|nr:hypothetical protein [Bryobacteraceae bacterium]